MVNVSPGAASSANRRHYRRGMTAQFARETCAGQDATTRTVMCPVCKALYTPAPAHQQLALAPHIVLESAFMSMCHFCFRCRRAACPDCWDAVHGVCGACVEEAHLPFRTQVKPLGQTFPRSGQEQQPTMGENRHNASVLVCIQHGRFYREPAQSQSATSAYPPRMSRPIHIATPEFVQRSSADRDGRPQQATTPQRERDNGRPQGATPHNHPPPVPTMTTAWEHCGHSRDGGGEAGRGGPLRASVVSPSGNGGIFLFRRPSYPKYAEVREENKVGKGLRLSEQPIGWIAVARGAIEQWATGALLILLLTILTMIVLAEASPSANAQILHVFQIDIRSEVAYLIHLTGQLH